MKITFAGGAQTVTGSQHIVSVNGKNILLECGLFQGRRAEAYEKNQNFPFDPASISAVVLSHAHIDHCGNIPNLVKRGFKGQIFAIDATVDLCKLLLRDSAYLQEKDLEWVNKIRYNKKEAPLMPLYSYADVEQSLEQFVGVPYEHTVTVGPGINVRFHEAGHILGSAGVLLEIEENGKALRLGFSGDVGRPDTPILRDPNKLRELDFLIVESTYGNRLHGSYSDVEEELAETIRDVAAAGGKIIIPAFAVGRTQHIVYLLHKLFDQNRIPDMPVYVDSPLACSATEVFRNYPDYYDREANRVFLDGDEDPFGFKRLSYITDVEESKKLNGLSYPHIIISASGMAEGGRILHHLRNNIGHHRNLVLFVGYAARETLARKIMEGAPSVKIFGEEHEVRCKIKIMDAFSAHADRKELLDYIDITSTQRLKHIFLVHGEPDQALPLRDALRSKGYPNVHFPAPQEVYSLGNA
ncbi:MAG: MBL fold metallo-hydrolase [Chitinivibrionales bacterium]|nr:MBL fold metallo-hydrolase [Chitinivibrionales bacterium]